MKTSLAAIALSAVAFPVAAQPVLAPAYGNHMVLQRGVPIVVAGTAAAGATVRGTLGTVRAQGKADGEGAFTLIFPARAATTSAMSLTIEDGTGEVRADDILVGDVFLCAGQSNMELPVERALNTWNELRLSADDAIRLITVPKSTAAAPRKAFPETVGWVAAKAETVAPFSAACYFMAKQLRADRADVPVGLVHSNWGGSAARAWLAPAGVESLFGKEALDQLDLYERDPLAAARAFALQWYDWWKSGDGGRTPWTDSALLSWKPVPKISFWNDWKGTGLDTNPTANVWLRKRFTLSKEEAAGGGTLSIGAIDDMDMTWVNGSPVGYTFGWGVERHYRVPAANLHEGENEVLIAANNMWDTGGFFAGPDRLLFAPASGGNLPLGEGWEYSVAERKDVPPRAPWDANAGLGVMHNAMIAPLGPMRLAGVAWYQGEADVGQPGYAKRLAALFAGWRAQFGEQARMLVVQLADYGARQSQPAPSGWAQLRQEQLDGVTADPNAALVTAIDIGEPSDIHPANKNVLGRRLAAAFEGQAMPMPASARREAGGIVVRFTGIEGDLRTFGGPYPLGVELCGEEQATCRWTIPALTGNALVIPDDGQPATRVRYLWADAPAANLYDGREMPVPGFTLEIAQ